MLDLEGTIGVQPIALEQRMTVAEVEQGALGNRHYQPVVTDGGRIMGV
jgi:hypothetical protein